jgi:hypothetical protein
MAFTQPLEMQQRSARRNVQQHLSSGGVARAWVERRRRLHGVEDEKTEAVSVEVDERKMRSAKDGAEGGDENRIFAAYVLSPFSLLSC